MRTPHIRRRRAQNKHGCPSNVGLSPHLPKLAVSCIAPIQHAKHKKESALNTDTALVVSYCYDSIPRTRQIQLIPAEVASTAFAGNTSRSNTPQAHPLTMHTQHQITSANKVLCRGRSCLASAWVGASRRLTATHATVFLPLPLVGEGWGEGQPEAGGRCILLRRPHARTAPPGLRAGPLPCPSPVNGRGKRKFEKAFTLHSQAQKAGKV